MQGEYITDRLLPAYVKQACESLGFECEFFSDDWVIRVENGAVRRWVIGYTFDINSSAATAIANDKVAMSMALSHENIASVMHYLARKYTTLSSLDDLPSDAPVVIKPLSGSGGYGVERVRDKSAALEIVRQSDHPDWAISPYYDIVSEKRLIMLDGDIICSYSKTQPFMRGGLKLFNLSQGAVAVNEDPSSKEKHLATRALLASGLRLASVDIATKHDGELITMEINSGICMEHYARQSKQFSDYAARTYNRIISAMMR